MVFASHTGKEAKLRSDYEPTVDTPWLALTGELWGAFSEFFGEQILQESAITLHNDSLRKLVYNMNMYLTGARRLNFESCHMQILAPMAAPEVVVLTTHGTTSDDKACPMTTPRALNEGRRIINFTPVTSCTPYGKEIVQVNII